MININKQTKHELHIELLNPLSLSLFSFWPYLYSLFQQLVSQHAYDMQLFFFSSSLNFNYCLYKKGPTSCNKDILTFVEEMINVYYVVIISLLSCHHVIVVSLIYNQYVPKCEILKKKTREEKNWLVFFFVFVK